MAAVVLACRIAIMSLAEEGGSEYDFTTPHHYPSAPLQQRPQHVVVRRTSSTGHFNAFSDAAGDGWVLPGAAELQHGTWTEYQRDYVPSLGDSHAHIAAKVTEATTSSPDSVAHQAGWPELRRPPHQAGTAPSLMKRSRTELEKRFSLVARKLQGNLDIRREKRPFFIWYTILLQLAVLTCTLFLYPIAPINFRPTLITESVLAPSGQTVLMSKNVSGNIFIGAKYTPCMHKDAKMALIMNASAQLQAEEETGCCLRSGNQYCFASSHPTCQSSGGSFNNQSTCHGAICCIDPAAYPDCDKIPEDSIPPSAEYDVCRCETVAAPCCTGIQGECSIKTKDQCDFLDGIYNPNATVCSEVNCLEAKCGLSRFNNPDYPDQWYRFMTAVFLPVGALHFLLFALIQLMIGQSMEKVIGTWRFSLLWLISGTGGYIASAIFTPYQIESGPSPAVYGLISALLIELLQNWKRIRKPCTQLLKLLVVIAIALCVGLLPYIDNFAHIGGFLFGLVSAVALLPWTTFGKWDKARKRLFSIIFLGLTCGLYAALLPIFLTGQAVNCTWCGYFNCVDFVPGMCEDAGQRFVL